MTDHPLQPDLAPAIRTLLATLRRRVRRYVWLEGIALAIAWLGIAFWISLGIDWSFEPSRAVRGVLLGAVLVGLAWIVFRFVLRRAFVPLSDQSLAVLLERRYPQFHDRLITAVELTARGAGGVECNPHMLARTCREAAQPVADVRLDDVFNQGPLRQRIALAGVLAVGVITFAVFCGTEFAVWSGRCLQFSNELWPRKTRLVMGEPFENRAVVKIARGSDLDVLVKADLDKPLVPSTVEIRSRTDGGARERKWMNREGVADPERDEFQRYTFTFRGVLTPVTFDVYGGDDVLRQRRIEVVDSPSVGQMWLDIEYPKYTALARRTVPVTGLMQVPVGSDVTVRARANKPLVRVAVDTAGQQPPRPPVIVEPAADTPQEFAVSLGKFTKDRTLLFTLLDADGIKSREPVRLTLAAQEDRRPEFAVQLKGIGQAVTPLANIPTSGTVTDDYGVARVWFEYDVGQGTKPSRQPAASPAGNPTELPANFALDVRPLGLTAGQKLQLCLKAEDRCDLPEPNVGSSDRWLLDVVTPAQLRTMLQARELMLRQRFETTVHEMVETRDSLARIEFESSPRPKPAAEKESKPSSPGAEPGEKPVEEDRSPDRLLAQRALRLQSAAQNSRKDAQETLGVAQAFDDIRAELVNNRIDTEELKIRLENRIAIPLHRVAEEMFPELDRRLDQLQASLNDPQVGPQDRQRAVAQIDAILLSMREVLKSMLEMEDFNEAVELLRTIIQSQEKIDELTKQRQKQKLRDLIEP